MAEETPQTVLDDVGRRVAELRQERGWTQRHVADALGMLIADYQAIERGRRNCTMRTLVHVARAFGVATRDLFAAPATRGARRPGRPKRSTPAKG